MINEIAQWIIIIALILYSYRKHIGIESFMKEQISFNQRVLEAFGFLKENK